jgi:hypothetical protein
MLPVIAGIAEGLCRAGNPDSALLGTIPGRAEDSSLPEVLAGVRG